MNSHAKALAGIVRTDVQGQLPNHPPQPLRWHAMFYVEWNEWMVGWKWNSGVRLKLGPFGVSIFKSLAHSHFQWYSSPKGGLR